VATLVVFVLFSGMLGDDIGIIRLFDSVIKGQVGT